MEQQSFSQRIGLSLSAPFDGMTWPQLAAVVVFVLVITAAWRQVVLFITQEI